jgi:ABC-2 type transport system ATP-binding protein
VAVAGLSLAIPRGSVFGLLGPNGAGKTTTLRMIMNVLAPDSGSIEILGRPADQASRDRIGYMPEERGLYPRMLLDEQLLFFAELKGTPREQARARLPAWFERLGLDPKWRRRRLNELSKGMQQKAQFIATVLLDLRRQGKTLVLSSHQMEAVERLCDAIALINNGEKLLDGAIGDVKRRYGRNSVVLAYTGDGAFLQALPGVARVSDHGQYAEIRLEDGADPQHLLEAAARRLRVSRFEIVEPSLHDIFVEQVTRHSAESAAAPA